MATPLHLFSFSPSYLLLQQKQIYTWARKQAATAAATAAAAEQIRSAKEKKNNAATIRFTPALLQASLPDDNTRAR